MRVRLPQRRESVVRVIDFRSNDGNLYTYIVTFSFDERATIKEVFCSSAKIGSDMKAFINDSCIAISLLLQHGMSIAAIAAAFGENRSEGEKSGPPSSQLGAIARMGAILEASYGNK